MNLKETVIGIEFGSTRIKAVMLDKNNIPVASGSHEWENKFEGGIWTYSHADIVGGLQACFSDLKRDVKEKLGTTLTTTGAMGISGMMHGYFALDKNNEMLAEFRTWRNTITEKEAAYLTELFGFTVPQRWSIAHLYRTMLLREEHLARLNKITTLAGYIHLRLTGEHSLGVGEASGMFPIDIETKQYDAVMLDKFDKLSAECGYSFKIKDLLPRVKIAGEVDGYLTEEGARFIDPEGDFLPGVPFCPTEGDGETGMVATNSVRVGTGNVSLGTSDFAMVVIDKKLPPHKEINIVTTPDGMNVAMIHCSNCTSDINAWVGMLGEFASLIGAKIDTGTLYTTLFNKAMEGDADCGGLLSYNYISGEVLTGMESGRPVFMRSQNSSFTLANFMRTHLMSALSTLKLGMKILDEEEVRIDSICGHGGYLKTPIVGQTLLSAALRAPVTVMETAGEGGPYGIALLSAYTLRGGEYSLPDYLDKYAFATTKKQTLMANDEDIEGFERFAELYRAGLPVERAAIDNIP